MSDPTHVCFPGKPVTCSAARLERSNPKPLLPELLWGLLST